LTQSSIFFIFAWDSGVSWAADGARRIISDMRAQVNISIPWGQGRQ
jgi:hypothetical protein